MKISETKAEGLIREYAIVISAAEIDEQVSSKLAELATTVNMPGFRPGKVPMSVVKSRFGPQVQGEAMKNALDEGARQVWNDMWAIVVWALVLSTVAAPLMLRWAIAVHKRGRPFKRSTFMKEKLREEGQTTGFVVTFIGRHFAGRMTEVANSLKALGVALPPGLDEDEIKAKYKAAGHELEPFFAAIRS